MKKKLAPPPSSPPAPPTATLPINEDEDDLDLTPEDYALFEAKPPRTPSTPEARGLFRLTEVRSLPVTWLWRGRVPVGKLTLLEGDPGLGKSTLLLDLTARLTTARPLPDDPHLPDAPASVVILSAEDAASDTIRPRLEAAGADLGKVFVWSHLPRALGGGLPEFPRDLSWIRAIVQRFHPSLVVIDPLMAYLSPRVNAHSDQAVRRALAPLAALAERTGVAIVAIRHLTKRASSNPLYRGGGSIGLIGAARSALLVARDPDDPTGARCVVASSKSNLGPPPPALAYRVQSAENGLSLIAWDGLARHTAASLAAESTLAHDPSALSEAVQVLAAILADGPVPADVVQRQAAQAGFGVSLLRRAKLALGVRSRRVGRPGEAGQHWIWERGPIVSPPPTS